MIHTFGNKETEKIWIGERVKGFPDQIQQLARRKMRMIHHSQNLSDLMIPPGNRLEKLKGRWIDFYSIRVNQQWRLVFKWLDNDAYSVQLIDYH